LSNFEANPIDGRTPPPSWKRDAIVLTAIAAVGALLRFVAIGDLSFWSDEVVTMMLAKRESLTSLLDAIQHWDATRAVLHPYLLHQWISLFGASETAARAFSGVCGMATIGLVYLIGRQTSDRTVGLWAAWLAAISPLDVHHSREVRMYAWLVMITCASWSLLLSTRRSAPWWKGLGLWGFLTALVYSHPLGTLMITALAAGYLTIRRESKLGWPAWIVIQVGVVLAFLPWAPRYLDHDPEVFVARLNAWYLFEWPEAFTGGRAEMVAACVGLIGWGFYSRRKEDRRGSMILLAWFLVPTALLLAYSLVRHPIFGHRRYLLFVGPAYLLLVARGLAALPYRSRVVVGLVMAYVALATMPVRVFRLDRSHYRLAAAEIRRADPGATIVVPTHGTRVCLGYYLDGWESMKLDSEVESGTSPDRIWFVSCTALRANTPVGPKIAAEYATDSSLTPPGLRLIHMHRRDATVATGDRAISR
jgi:mannosyltransferase